MFELIKEDLFTIIKKKRFIVMTAILFVAAVGFGIYTKIHYMNNVMFLVDMRSFLKYVFDPVMGIALIISVYHVKYTKFCIEQVEEKGLKRYANIVSKFVSGSVIIICVYALLCILMLFLGLVLGAHLTGYDTETLVLMLFWDCIGAIGLYALALFFLTLFAFPVFPAILYTAISIAAPIVLGRISWMDEIRSVRFITAKCLSEVLFTGAVFGDVSVVLVIALIVETAIPLLFSLLVFKLKKIRVKKSKIVLEKSEEPVVFKES